MINNWKHLTSNAKKVCLADFFWNLGRTLPHAILTIFLLYQGCTLAQLAILQSIFMIVAMVTEFPSGVWADKFSRKNIYLLSLVTLFTSYLLIGFYSQNFVVLCISYVLYGLSVSLKSGTLEAEVILELSNSQELIKEYSIISSYIMSISSIVGGLVGSVLYSYIHQKLYIISLILFGLSFASAMLCSFNKNDEEQSKEGNTLCKEIIEGFSIIKQSKILKYILSLFAVSTLFIQPFFQYWQVLYKDNNVAEQYFGIIYVLFQVCNIIGIAIYKKIKMNQSKSIVILLMIPIIYGITSLFEWGVIISLPLSVIAFYIYSMHLDVIQKQYAPKKHISSFFSLVGTIQNVVSIGSLFIMASCINVVGSRWAYFIVFVLFTCLMIILQNALNASINNNIENI